MSYETLYEDAHILIQSRHNQEIADLASSDPMGKVINKTPYAVVVTASAGVKTTNARAIMTSLASWLMNGGALISKAQFTISPNGCMRLDEDDMHNWSIIQRAIAQDELTSYIK